MTKIIFMGTPAFAVPSLMALIKNYTVAAVVTQPDRPQGRGRKLIPSPVKEAALTAGVPVLQPITLKDPAAVAELAALKPDVIVVAAFGQILRPDVLEMPPYGCINIHASLLPRWRGAAPVAAAIRAGDAETGVTLMKMDEGLDTGDIIHARAISIRADHTRASLTMELAQLGADLLRDTLPDWLAVNIMLQPQHNALATVAPRIKKEAGHIDWRQSAVEIERLTRAFHPWPGAFSLWNDARIKIISARVVEKATAQPGVIFKFDDRIAVGTGRGALVLVEIQPESKRAMAAGSFANGAPNFIGTKLT